MNKKYIIVLLLLFSLKLNAQINFGLENFLNDTLNDKPIKTEDLLKQLNWESIKKYHDTVRGTYIDTNKGIYTMTYVYINNHNNTYFSIRSYQDIILEFGCITKTIKINYLNKNLWIKFGENFVKNIPDSFKINQNEFIENFKAYYKLIGIDSHDEYGWICEYSTVGKAPDKREATIQLIKSKRIDLLKKLLDYPNVQTQLYAADALIYLNYIHKEIIKKEIKKGADESYLKYQYYTLSEADWKKIYNIRDSDTEVITCGNAGSYKQYKIKTSELLSEKAILEIPIHYENLQNHGYFDYQY
jgi:hypothetical protein